MANTREFRRRIRSVKNISQITRAMQMVAATKMRRAQSQALNGRPYFETLTLSLDNIMPGVEGISHPFLKENEAKKTGLILLSTDKSLCGALNTNLFRSVISFMKDHSGLVFYTIGKKGRDFVVKTGNDLAADFENEDTVKFSLARQVTKLLIDSFLSNELHEVYLAYPYFVTALNQQPKIIKLLPIESSFTNNPAPKTQKTFLLEPNPTELLDLVLNHFLETTLYSALVETKASEHAARMIAMQNATENAQDLVEDLELSYNQVRQSSITQEILEITAASKSME